MCERAYQGATYQLAGPGPLTHAEMAAIISEEIGKPVEAVHRDLVDWKAWATERGWTDYAIKNYMAMCTHYDQHGAPSSARWWRSSALFRVFRLVLTTAPQIAP